MQKVECGYMILSYFKVLILEVYIGRWKSECGRRNVVKWFYRILSFWFAKFTVERKNQKEERREITSVFCRVLFSESCIEEWRRWKGERSVSVRKRLLQWCLCLSMNVKGWTWPMTMFKEIVKMNFKLLCISVKCMGTWVHVQKGIRVSGKVVSLPYVSM